HAHDGPHEGGYAQSRVSNEQEPSNPGERCRQSGNHDERIQPRLKVDYDQQVNEHYRERQSAYQADIGGSHRLNLPANYNSRTPRDLLTRGVKDLIDVAGY